MKALHWMAAVALALMALTQYELHAMHSSVNLLVHARVEDTQLAASRWREIEGVATSITTYREAGETEEDFIERHLASMRKMRDALKEEPEAQRIERR